MTDIIERLQAEIERTVTLDLMHQEDTMSTLYGPWTAGDDGRHLYDDGEHDIRLDIDGNWPSADARITFADALAHALNNANEIARLRANITTMEAAARDAIEILRKEKDAEILRLRVAHHEDTAILHETIVDQRRIIECLMRGMPEDGTTPVIQRIAAMEDDAKRYRWLRDVGDETWPPFAKRAGLSVAKIDAAIDEAMKDKP